MKTTTTRLATAASLLLIAVPAAADFVIADDLIVDGSACIGLDCVNGESFGFDTLRLKENNLRINFADTSNSASFPTSDWRIVANDSANGGASYLAIEDSDNSRQLFRVTAGAPANSLTVDAQGDVGLGLLNAVVELHMRDGDTPTLRLEQDGSSGFTPQTWDVAGNETNFFIRDTTNGSKLPLRIRPDAPTNSIYVDTGGNIGLGTNAPGDALHLNRTSGNTTDFRIGNTSGSVANWRFRANQSNGSFTIKDEENGGSAFKIFETSENNTLVVTSTGVGIKTATPNAAAALDVNGPVYLRGAVLHADYVFEPEYQLESIDDHAEFMWNNRHLPAVPKRQVDEDGREFISIGADRRGIVEELEKAHIYIEQLHQGLRDKDARLEVFAERLDRLEGQLTVSDQ